MARFADFIIRLLSKDEASQDIEKVADEVADLEGKEAKVGVGTEGADQAAEELSTVGEAVNAVDGASATATADVEADVSQAEEVTDALDNIDGTEAKATAAVEGDTTGAVEVTDALDSIDGRSVTASANITTPPVGDIQKATGAVHGLGQAAEFMGKAGLTGSTGMAKIATVAAGAAAPIAAAGAAAKGSLDAYMKLASATTKAAAAFGMTTEEYSRWIAVADDANVEAAQLNQSFGFLTREIAKGGPALAKFGIATKDVNGDLRGTNEVMLDVIGVLNAIEDPTAQAVAGTQLLGRSYKQLAPLVGATEDQMRAYLAAVEKGQVITAEEAKKAEEMRRAQDNLQDSLLEVKLAVGELMVELLPLIEILAKAIGVIGKVVGPIVDLATGVSDLGKKARDAVRPMDELGENVRKIGRDAEEGERGLKLFGKGAKEASDGGKDAADTFADAAKAMLDSGVSAADAANELEKMGASAEQVDDAMKKAGVDSKELAKAQADAAQAAAEAAAKEEELKAALEGQVEALKASAAASEERTNAMRAAADASFAVTEAQSDYNDALAELGPALQEAGGDLTKQKVAYDDVVQSASKLADQTLRLAQDQATQAGATMSSTQELDAWNSSMLKSASQATPAARAAILDYIATVNAIPPEQITQISAMIEAGDLAGAEKALANLSKNRTMTLQADADTKAAEAGIKGLEQVAAGTSATVPVGANTGPADADVDALLAKLTQTGATVPVAANTAPAAASITTLAKQTPTTTITADANTKPASKEITATTVKDWATTVGVDADTALAAAVILTFISRKRIAEIVVELTGSAEVRRQLNDLAKVTKAPVDAYLREYPTNAEIARKIGTVRVPVDAYTRTEPRITGVR